MQRKTKNNQKGSKIFAGLFNLALLMSMIFPLALSAQEEETEEITKLGKVVVTSSKRSSKVKDLPVDVEIITREDIENSGQTSISDVVIGIVTGNSYKIEYANEVASNGMFDGDAMGDPKKDQVLVLIDGHKAGSGSLSNIPSEIVERIEVLKGPASAVYGSQAMGGVINIITRKGLGKNTGIMFGETGSFGYKKIGASNSGNITDWIRYFMSASYEKKDDHDSVENGTAYNSDKKMLNLTGNFIFDISDSQNLKIGYLFTDLKYGLPKINTSTNTYYEENLQAAKYSKIMMGIDFDYKFEAIKDTLDFDIAGFYNQYDYNYDKKYRSSVTSALSDTSSYWKEYSFITRGIDASGSYDLPINNSFMKNTIVAGYSFENYVRESAKWNYSDAYAMMEKPGTDQYMHSPYIQDNMSLLNNMISIVAGARYDYYKMSKIEPENYDDMNTTEQEKYESGSKTFDHISPRIGIAVNPTHFLKIRAHYGQGMRIPTASELLGVETTSLSGTSTTNYAPNTDLEPEKTTSYEGGIDLSFKIIYFTTGYRVVKYTDKIESETYSVGDYDKRYINSDSEYTTECIDGGITLRLGSILQNMGLPVYVKLTTNFIYYTKYENDEGDKLENINEYEIKTNLNIMVSIISFTLSHQYLGPQITDSATEEERDSVNYIDMNASIQLGENFQVYGGVYNLTNVVEYTPEKYLPERNYKLGIKSTF